MGSRGRLSFCCLAEIRGCGAGRPRVVLNTLRAVLRLNSELDLTHFFDANEPLELFRSDVPILEVDSESST